MQLVLAHFISFVGRKSIGIEKFLASVSKLHKRAKQHIQLLEKIFSKNDCITAKGISSEKVSVAISSDGARKNLLKGLGLMNFKRQHLSYWLEKLK